MKCTHRKRPFRPVHNIYAYCMNISRNVYSLRIDRGLYNNCHFFFLLPCFSRPKWKIRNFRPLLQHKPLHCSCFSSAIRVHCCSVYLTYTYRYTVLIYYASMPRSVNSPNYVHFLCTQNTVLVFSTYYNTIQHRVAYILYTLFRLYLR